MNSRRFFQSVVVLPLALLAGCAGLNDCHYESTQKARAVRQYVECGKPSCEKFPHDYKLGWLDGFYNIATGGPTCPPAVAPQRYWDPKTVLAHCDARRHSYYSGWQDGASRASQFPDTHHLKIFETCECPMPRCDQACGTGGCVPCGLGSVGAPVHDELIETPYQGESITPTPAVPMMSHEHTVVPEPPTETEVASVTETDAVEATTVATIQPEDGSTVVLQESDPIGVVMTQSTPSTDVRPAKPLATETINPIDAIFASTAQQRSESIAKQGSSRNAFKNHPSLAAKQAGTVRLVERDTVPKVIEVKAEATTFAPPTRHPAVALETLPVRFEMIESNDSEVIQAK